MAGDTIYKQRSSLHVSSLFTFSLLLVALVSVWLLLFFFFFCFILCFAFYLCYIHCTRSSHMKYCINNVQMVWVEYMCVYVIRCFDPFSLAYSLASTIAAATAQLSLLGLFIKQLFGLLFCTALRADDFIYTRTLIINYCGSSWGKQMIFH